MDQVRELDGILDEEDGDVVTNNIYSALVQFHCSIGSGCLTKVAFVGVESDGKSMYIANSISRATTSSDCREADKDGGFFLCGAQKRCPGDV
jgi:hypothetical protein